MAVCGEDRPWAGRVRGREGEEVGSGGEAETAGAAGDEDGGHGFWGLKGLVDVGRWDEG